MIDRAIVRNVKQERREFRAGFVARTRRDQMRPNFLKQIRRGTGVAHMAQKIAIQGAFVVSVQRSKRCAVTVPVTQHQVSVIVRRNHRVGSIRGGILWGKAPGQRAITTESTQLFSSKFRTIWILFSKTNTYMNKYFLKGACM